MAGISRKWIWALAALSVLFSCVKEKAIEEPVDNAPERFAEYDPVVRFGLETFMGEDPVTKTTYAGDGQTVLFESKRYERINWNVWTSSTTDKANKPDTVRVLAVDAFTKNGKTQADYSPWEIPGFTNMPDSKDSPADAKPVPVGDDEDNLYWAQSTDARYFYAVYPSPTGRPATYKPAMTVSGPDGSHKVTVTGSIPREQPYVKLDNSVSGVWEYMPNMADAYMYAAAKIPSADAGYVKVPLRFKPLFSAIKLIVTASDAGAKNYRLKRVDLRTDLFYDDLNQGDPNRVNASGNGTALNGDFTATFSTTLDKGDNEPEYTGDFTVTTHTGKDPATRDTTNKRLTIRIPEHERVWLGDDTVKLTFLALPIKQEVMTVVYTFEKKDDGGNLVLGDDGKPLEVTRYLALQTRTKASGERNEFSGDGWYELEKAHKLYIRSGVPEIQYYFDVQTQGNFPRTWNSEDPNDATTNHFYSDDFYSVQSYRDSAGVKQSLKWKVTGYKKPLDDKYEMINRPDWLRLRGDDGTWDETAVANRTYPYNPASGVNPTGDPWSAPWGAGTPVDENGAFATASSFAFNQRNYIKGTSFVSYTAAAKNNGSARNQDVITEAGKPDVPDVFNLNRDWDTPVSYLFKDLDGKYYYQDDHNHIPSAGWKGLKGEAYAYDLSSHDIYGKLTVAKNGDLGTTANCYVVSAPGWYRFPAVYGNAITGGKDNTAAYNRDATEADGIMGAFLDHNANGITSPEIPGIDAVEVLWDDTQGNISSPTRHLVARHFTTDTFTDRGAFYHKEPSDTYGYIYFYVDDIAQGNALVAAYSGGTIVWSWHIWAVTHPAVYLETIELQSNQEQLNPYEPLNPDPSDNRLTPLDRTSIELYEDLSNETTIRKSRRDQTFWKMSDLGQNGIEDADVEPRYCDVEFTQYFRGKVVKKVVRRFLQSGVKDAPSDTPGYQWGRKDPFRPGYFTRENCASLTVENTHMTIQKPTTLYISDNTTVPTGKRYDNLWNAEITTQVEDSYADGRPTGSLDRDVVKTIYDPSPAGFVMPNLYAFSGFNPYGPISSVKIPRSKRDEVAYKPLETYPHYYVDFYTDYYKDADYKRKKDKNKTMRIYLLGRINGTLAADGYLHNVGGAYYWTSEPALFPWNGSPTTIGYHGRSFTVDAASFKASPKISNPWHVWPVSGIPEYKVEAKWQRTHGNRVRPMVDQ